MRLVFISLLMGALAWLLLDGHIPLSLGEGAELSRENALFALLLLSALTLLEGVHSWSKLRRLRRLTAECAVLSNSLSEEAKRIDELQQAKDAVRLELENASSRILEVDMERSSIKSALEAENRALKQALARAEAERQQGSSKNTDPGREAIHFLSRMQEKGRFIDFIMEDVSGYSDQQVGSAARFVHDGCRAVVREYLDLGPVQDGKEGGAITISSAEQADGLRFIGKSATKYPVTGRLVHRGWRIMRASFPELSTGSDVRPATAVLAPAEIELQ